MIKINQWMTSYQNLLRAPPLCTDPGFFFFPTWAPNLLNYTRFGAEQRRPSWLGKQVASVRALGLLWDYMKVWEIQQEFDHWRPCWFTGEPNTSAYTWQSITYSCLRERWEWNTWHTSFTFSQFNTMGLGTGLMPDLLILSNHSLLLYL